MSEPTPLERPASPSPEVSFLEPSLGSCSTYITAPSCRTADLVASVIGRSTPFGPARVLECQQLFVKGLAAHTIVLSSLELPVCVNELKSLLFQETGIPEALITLLHGGKRLEDHHSLTTYKIPHNATLQGYTHSVGKGDFRDELDEREMREMRDILFSELHSSKSTMDGASLGSYARRESTRQRLYTNYLRARGFLVHLPSR